MTDKKKSDIEKKQEHILVCLSASPSNARIVHTAAKMAHAFQGAFTALFVQTPGHEKMDEENRIRLQKHMKLAEQSGASISTVFGEDVSYQIAEFARISGVTKIVIGRSNAKQHHFWNKPTLTEKLIELAPNLDIYIIPDSTLEKTYREKKHSFTQHMFPSMEELLIILLVLAAATGIGILFWKLGFTESNIITIYILAVLLTSLFTKSHVCNGISSLSAVLLFNFFFTEPRLTLHAYEPGYPVTFAIMLTAALITGTLANKLKTHAKQSAQAAFRTQVLFDTNQLLQKAKDEEEVLNITSSQLLKLLERDADVYLERNGHLGLRLKEKSRPLDSFENSVTTSILGEGALAIENIRNAEKKKQAEILAQKEQMRANLLRAISHDLRTPLTSISGNASNLLVNDTKLEDDTRMQMYMDIYDDSQWLISLVENLLSVTRIEEGRLNFKMTEELIDEVLEEALRHINRNKVEHDIILETGEELLLAKMDVKLILQVVINLVDNAIKYTPKGSTITVSARRQEDKIAVQVADNGAGIPEELKDKVFEMFFTGENTIVDSRRSLGLGLALCKSIIHAHGGELKLTDNVPHGCVFTFTLLPGEVKLDE